MFIEPTILVYVAVDKSKIVLVHARTNSAIVHITEKLTNLN